MKKLIGLLLALAIVFSLCACTADPAQQSDPTGDPTASVDTTGAADAGNEKDDDEIDLSTINEFEPNDKGIYQIHSAEGLKNIANVLDGKFELLCDIDLGGAEWVPVGTQDAPFTGRMNGKTFTVSNFTISQPAADGNMGFFGVSKGSIMNLVLKDMTVTTTDKTVNVGAIAGVSSGDIMRVEAYGTIDAKELAEGASCGGAVGTSSKIIETVTTEISINCEAEGAANIGTGVGMQNGSKIIKSEFGGTLNVADAEKKNVGLLVGYANDCKVEENKFAGTSAVMANEPVVALFGLARNSTDTANATRYTGFATVWPEDVQARRDKLVELAYEMATVEWYVPEYMEYKNHCACCDTRTFMPGRTYRGIPYNHYNGSMQRFVYAMDKQADGTYMVSDWLKNLTSHDGYDTWDMYLGNDCCSAMIQLYATVSNNCNIKRSVNQFAWFDEEYEANMEETYPITASGAIPVGGWDYKFIELDPDHYTYGSKRYVYEQPEDPETGLSGVERMYWCYAHMSKGDMLSQITTDGSGHVQMTSADPFVMLDAEGNIDPEQSYVTTIQQVQGFHEHEDYISSWFWDGARATYTFKQLAESFYLPQTFIELIESNDDTPEVSMKDAQQGRFALTSGTVTSNFYLDSVEMTVTDDAGNEVLNERMFVTVDKNTDQYANTWNVRFMVKEFDMAHFAPAVSQVQWDTNKTYHCTVKAYLTTAMFDNELTVTEFDF